MPAVDWLDGIQKTMWVCGDIFPPKENKKLFAKDDKFFSLFQIYKINLWFLRFVPSLVGWMWDQAWFRWAGSSVSFSSCLFFREGEQRIVGCWRSCFLSGRGWWGVKGQRLGGGGGGSRVISCILCLSWSSLFEDSSVHSEAQDCKHGCPHACP